MRAGRHRACSAEARPPGLGGQQALPGAGSSAPRWATSEPLPVPRRRDSNCAPGKAESLWIFSLTCVPLYFKYQILISLLYQIEESVHSFIQQVNVERRTVSIQQALTWALTEQCPGQARRLPSRTLRSGEGDKWTRKQKIYSRIRNSVKRRSGEVGENGGLTVLMQEV